MCVFFVSNIAYDRFQRCICWMDGIRNIIIDSMENVLHSIELFDLNKVLCIYLYCFYCSSHVKINFRNGFYFPFIREWRQGYNFPARYSQICPKNSRANTDVSNKINFYSFFSSLLNVHYQNVYRLFPWSQSETHDTFIQNTHISASVAERCLQRIMLHWPNNWYEIFKHLLYCK